MSDMEIKLASNFRHPETGVLHSAGERVTLALQPSDVHDPQELATYLAGYKPFQYRADELSKVVLVDNDEDKYRAFDSDDAFRKIEVKTSGMAKVQEVDPQSALTTYKVVERAIGSFVPDQTQSQGGNSYDPLMAAARRCRRALELDREIDVFGTPLLGTTTNWASTVRTQVAATYQWNGGANADPIKDIQDAIGKSFQPVTEIWMNQTVAHTFLRNDTVRDHMRQMIGDQSAQNLIGNVSMAGSMNIDFLIPGFPPFRVSASKVKNESTSAVDYVMPNYVYLVTTPPGVPMDGEEIATTYTFRRKGPSGVGFEVREFRVEDRGSLGGTMVVASNADIAKITGSNCGGVIYDVIQ